MTELYIGILLFVMFLLMDVVLYAFKSASENVNESGIENILAKFSRLSDTLDIVVFGTNLF